MSALIDPATLAAIIDQPDLHIIDATYPANPPFFQSIRIGNAISFDIDAICDQTTSLPHMLPSADEFAAAVGAMGIGNDDEVIIYDQAGIAFAAARVWWMFRTFGHKKIRVLDGGLPAWHRAGYRINTLPPQTPEPVSYTARLNPSLVRSAQQVKDAIDNEGIIILDARPPERFAGLAAEPRPDMRAGHIPGSINVPSASIIDPQTGMLNRDAAQIKSIAGEHPSGIITSCGSGVTACVLALALHEAGFKEAAVYDGSWSEWGLASSDWPVAR
jgi:thiosulfate/3-mercaptopyruvate sulfurtransferase